MLALIMWWTNSLPQILHNESFIFGIRERSTYRICVYGSFSDTSDAVKCTDKTLETGEYRFDTKAYFVVRNSVEKIDLPVLR